jgi:hypothetical protein
MLWGIIDGKPLYGNLDTIDFAILYDVIEYYSRTYNLNATNAIKFYDKFRERQNMLDSIS